MTSHLGISGRALCLLTALLATTACVTARYVPTGGTYTARPPHCPVEVFTSGPPHREYYEIGILEGEGSLWKADLEDVLPRLREEACLAGGDALILLSSTKYARGDDDGDDLYAVATVIRWAER
jgi:hypothetical protein